MTNAVGFTISLAFPLDVDDGWPPVSVESLPFRASPDGYEALVSPLFVKDLSVGDVIEATIDPDDRVHCWRHFSRSGRSTIWLLRLRSSDTLHAVLAELRALGCNTVALDTVGAYSVDVPDSVSIEVVDAALAHLDVASVAVAFPSMRHGEKDANGE